MSTKPRRWIIGAALVVVMAALAVFLPGKIQQDLAQQSAQSVQEAVLRSAVQCYSVEGVYPSNLDYLEKYYGLIVDHETYIIGYDAFSSNLLPQVTVLVRGDEQGAGA